MEINFRHGDALDLADQITVFKRTMREAALKHNVAATFMAKPITDEPGSAMHIHQSVVDIATGKPIFANEDGQMSEAVPAATSVVCRSTSPKVLPHVRAERQLVPPFPAGHLGAGQRRMGRGKPHRRPAGADVQPGSHRVENRLPGADANPYLAIAASLLCGYIGMVEGIAIRARGAGPRLMSAATCACRSPSRKR
jgi:glutamine synthetase